MPTCVECGLSVTTLVTEYSKGNIVLTQCENCKKFADKYVEHDFVIIFIDMILHKPQVYRHLLFNRLEYQEKGIEPNVLKLGILLVLFDVCRCYQFIYFPYSNLLTPPMKYEFRYQMVQIRELLRRTQFPLHKHPHAHPIHLHSHDLRPRIPRFTRRRPSRY